MLVRGARSVSAWRCDPWRAGGPLLPFLYNTDTIRRPYTKVSRGNTSWRQKNSRPHSPVSVQDHEAVNTFSNNQKKKVPQDRNGQRSSRARFDHVPFERPGYAEGEVDLDESTITPGEKKAFEKLFTLKKKAKARRAEPKDGRGQRKSRDQDRDVGLDAILDAAIENINKSRLRPSPQFPPALRPMAEELRTRQRAEQEASRDMQREDAIKQDLGRVNALMDNARTDLQLWNTLKEHVLNRVMSLQLDGPPSTPSQSAAITDWLQLKGKIYEESRNDQSRKPSLFGTDIPDVQVMATNFPLHLLHFTSIMQTSYPASMLGLNLLPTLKKLGPSAFAFGATTALYNAHMRMLYEKHPADLHSIVDVLAEMDREVYDFDEQTEILLTKILKHARRLGRGDGGPGLQALWSTERTRRALRSIAEWRGVVEERRQETALKAAREAEALREAGIESDDAVTGSRDRHEAAPV